MNGNKRTKCTSNNDSFADSSGNADKKKRNESNINNYDFERENAKETYVDKQNTSAPLQQFDKRHYQSSISKKCGTSYESIFLSCHDRYKRETDNDINGDEARDRRKFCHDYKKVEENRRRDYEEKGRKRGEFDVDDKKNNEDKHSIDKNNDWGELKGCDSIERENDDKSDNEQKGNNDENGNYTNDNHDNDDNQNDDDDSDVKDYGEGDEDDDTSDIGTDNDNDYGDGNHDDTENSKNRNEDANSDDENNDDSYSNDFNDVNNVDEGDEDDDSDDGDGCHNSSRKDINNDDSNDEVTNVNDKKVKYLANKAFKRDLSLSLKQLSDEKSIRTNQKQKASSVNDTELERIKGQNKNSYGVDNLGNTKYYCKKKNKSNDAYCKKIPMKPFENSVDDIDGKIIERTYSNTNFHDGHIENGDNRKSNNHYDRCEFLIENNFKKARLQKKKNIEFEDDKNYDIKELQTENYFHDEKKKKKMKERRHNNNKCDVTEKDFGQNDGERDMDDQISNERNAISWIDLFHRVWSLDLRGIRFIISGVSISDGENLEAAEVVKTACRTPFDASSSPTQANLRKNLDTSSAETIMPLTTWVDRDILNLFGIPNSFKTLETSHLCSSKSEHSHSIQPSSLSFVLSSSTSSALALSASPLSCRSLLSVLISFLSPLQSWAEVFLSSDKESDKEMSIGDITSEQTITELSKCAEISDYEITRVCEIAAFKNVCQNGIDMNDAYFLKESRKSSRNVNAHEQRADCDRTCRYNAATYSAELNPLDNGYSNVHTNNNQFRKGRSSFSLRMKSSTTPKKQKQTNEYQRLLGVEKLRLKLREKKKINEMKTFLENWCLSRFPLSQSQSLITFKSSLPSSASLALLSSVIPMRVSSPTPFSLPKPTPLLSESCAILSSCHPHVFSSPPRSVSHFSLPLFSLMSRKLIQPLSVSLSFPEKYVLFSLDSSNSEILACSTTGPKTTYNKYDFNHDERQYPKIKDDDDCGGQSSSSIFNYHTFDPHQRSVVCDKKKHKHESNFLCLENDSWENSDQRDTFLYEYALNIDDTKVNIINENIKAVYDASMLAEVHRIRCDDQRRYCSSHENIRNIACPYENAMTVIGEYIAFTDDDEGSIIMDNEFIHEDDEDECVFYRAFSINNSKKSMNTFNTNGNGYLTKNLEPNDIDYQRNCEENGDISGTFLDGQLEAISDMDIERNRDTHKNLEYNTQIFKQPIFRERMWMKKSFCINKLQASFFDVMKRSPNLDKYDMEHGMSYLYVSKKKDEAFKFMKKNFSKERNEKYDYQHVHVTKKDFHISNTFVSSTRRSCSNENKYTVINFPSYGISRSNQRTLFEPDIYYTPRVLSIDTDACVDRGNGMNYYENILNVSQQQCAVLQENGDSHEDYVEHELEIELYDCISNDSYSEGKDFVEESSNSATFNENSSQQKQSKISDVKIDIHNDDFVYFKVMDSEPNAADNNDNKKFCQYIGKNCNEYHHEVECKYRPLGNTVKSNDHENLDVEYGYHISDVEDEETYHIDHEILLEASWRKGATEQVDRENIEEKIPVLAMSDFIKYFDTDTTKKTTPEFITQNFNFIPYEKLYANGKKKKQADQACLSGKISEHDSFCGLSSNRNHEGDQKHIHHFKRKHQEVAFGEKKKF